MNDIELDRLLDVWEAPAPPPSLRAGLRTRFPQPERRRFFRPLLWALATVVVSITLAMGLAIGMEQSDDNPSDYRLVRVVYLLLENIRGGLEVRQASSVRNQVRESEPKVYVDGQLAAPLAYGPAATMVVQVPGEGVYSITSFRGPLTGWIEAGHIHGNLIEFQAGGKQVRIECNKTIVDSDRPVFVRRRP